MRLPRTLIDPRFEHESCGVGFVATLRDEPTHRILEQALEALARLAHRGAIAADGLSSDGIGICTQIPRALLLADTGVELAPEQPLAVGVVFFPQDVQGIARESHYNLEDALAHQGFRVLRWRDVPIEPSILGEIAHSTMPVIRHVLLTTEDLDRMERRLYLARKDYERRGSEGYICSLSVYTMIYKSMCSGRQLPHFYPDLEDPRYVTSFAIFHQRYATNVAPSWDRAQPLRTLAHNGEINTVWGNRARMDARSATIPDELKPIFSPSGSDSTSLDETVELLSHNGRSVAEAVRLMLPPAQFHAQSAFFAYNEDCVEHWDGPAAISFTDGRMVGAALDRNGLRPCRFFLTDDDLVVVGSEAGLVDLDPEHIVHSGRLGPGQMLVADLDDHRLYENDELQHIFDNAAPEYAALLDERTLDAATQVPPVAPEELNRLQYGFGYTREDVRMVLGPMAADGKDAIWSMGDDAPLAPLARSTRPVYGYFRQRFAQVTNPPIDSLREAVVIQLHTRLGPWPHMLDKRSPLIGFSLKSPYLSLGQVEALRARRNALQDELPLAVLECCFAPASTLAAAIEELASKSIELVRGGAAILLLTDRTCAESAIPMPMAMALGAVHHALIRAGVRTRTGLAVEAGDCRDIHHAAVLMGMGAGAVCPWLALETAKAADPENGERNLLKAFDAGIAKIMSKMGISVVDSYRGAHLFDALGLNEEVIHTCFFGTPAPLGGIGFAEVEEGVRGNWQHFLPVSSPQESDTGSPEDNAIVAAASSSTTGAITAPSAAASNPVVGPLAAKELPDYGWVRFRKAEGAEPHTWQPATVRLLQTAVGSSKAAILAAQKEPAGLTVIPDQAWATFSSQAVEKDPATLRDMLDFHPAGDPLALDAVEAKPSIYKRCVASAMSLGSLSPEAHQTVTAAMNMIGGRSNTGEGGEDRAVYSPDSQLMLLGKPVPASLLNNKIKQIASGRFGVTAEYLRNAQEIEIKIAQGAKPGEGGQLPGHKVTGLIARLRHAQPGVTLISPPPHHDIYSIEDLAQLIYDLKRVNPSAAIGVKLVSEFGVGTVAAGVTKAYADYIVIAGNSGGTGASSLSSIKYTGNPWELGLAEAQQVLLRNGLRGRVRLRVDGGLRTASDVLCAAMLGADEFAFGTAVLVALGCDMARQCHLNTCPTGIATQREDLRAKFRGKPEHVVRFFDELATDIQSLLAKLGLPSIEAAIGRTDLLHQTRSAGKIDLAALLSAPTRNVFGGAISWQGVRNDRPDEEPPIDDAWLAPAIAAYKAGQPFTHAATVSNKDRTLGARLSGELALLQDHHVESPAPLTFNLSGVAGQSFGAFAARGLELVLTGLANDFVGKGLCGGELVLRGVGRAARESEQHVILGNVALYGATSGCFFAAGRAGERFAVRNSGVLAIVEGVGDHGCEYMTGGTVVVLGRTGMNFGAGMTGGTAWVFDEDGGMVEEARYHTSFLVPEAYPALDAEAQGSIRHFIELHQAKTASTRAGWLLADWENLSAKFVRFTPKPQA